MSSQPTSKLNCLVLPSINWSARAWDDSFKVGSKLLVYGRVLHKPFQPALNTKIEKNLFHRKIFFWLGHLNWLIVYYRRCL